ncbi:hypothetical protein [Leptospira adleri]|uniref:Uncharacterized protein n=1 Tax=Leptospira adleri TaxID=2023186 RepID=A0A2M9YJB2_9LEPT|nr:hypothetical protein [Leptospira adleri]PJZ51635.1 hypothetical protein CH380_19515 [Leptospira adleri]PJZ61937.1 hypothetical protein CH376_11105 [Leptospira adleri]
MEFKAVILIADGKNGNPTKEDVSIIETLPVFFGNTIAPISSIDSQFGELKSTEWEGNTLLGTFSIEKIYPAIEGTVNTDDLKHTITGVRLSILTNQDERIQPIQKDGLYSKSNSEDLSGNDIFDLRIFRKILHLFSKFEEEYAEHRLKLHLRFHKSHIEQIEIRFEVGAQEPKEWTNYVTNIDSLFEDNFSEILRRAINSVLTKLSHSKLEPSWKGNTNVSYLK